MLGLFFIFIKTKIMENQDENTLVNDMENTGKRPQFLTVLCVLSFICVGLMIVMTLWGMVMNTPERMAENIEKMREFSPAQADKMEAAIEEQANSTMAKIQPFITILIEIISFLGVFMMFNLKRMGFYIYAAIEILPYSLMLFGSGKSSVEMGGLGEGAAMAMIVIAILFDIGFVVMYGLNLKHLKK